MLRLFLLSFLVPVVVEQEELLLLPVLGVAAVLMYLKLSKLRISPVLVLQL
jgi:hypothetical protein